MKAKPTKNPTTAALHSARELLAEQGASFVEFASIGGHLAMMHPDDLDDLDQIDAALADEPVRAM